MIDIQMEKKVEPKIETGEMSAYKRIQEIGLSYLPF